MKRWSECSEEERGLISNGVGPSYLPSWARAVITNTLSYYFDEASWEKHDFGYFWGHPSKSECDRKFFSAMLRDASRQPTTARTILAAITSIFLWYMVASQGHYSYNWLGPSYAELKFKALKAAKRDNL